MITQLIEFDVKKDSHVKITAKEGDINSRNLEFRLLDNSLPFSLAGRTVRCYMVKPDKRIVFSELQIIDAEDGRCVLTLSLQSLIVSGMAKLELIIYEAGKKLSAIPIKMNIMKSLVSDELLYSSDEFGALESALWKIDTFTETMNSKATKEELKKVNEELEHNKKELTDKINEVATKGTTAEVIENATKSQIDKYIEDGTIANLTIGDRTITDIKLVERYVKGEAGKNLFNKEDIILNKYVDPSTGNYLSGNGNFLIDKMEIDVSLLHAFTDLQLGAFYDSEGVFISGTNNITTLTGKQLPSNAKYVSISANVSKLNTAQIEIGSVATTYEPYMITVKENSVGTKNLINKSVINSKVGDKEIDNRTLSDRCINDRNLEVIYVHGKVGKNKFNKNNITKGYYIDPSTGQLISNAEHSVSNFIKIEDYKYVYTDMFTGAYYDENLSFIKGTSNLGAWSGTKPDTLAKYIRVSVKDTKLETAQMEIASNNGQPTYYEEYKQILDLDYLEPKLGYNLVKVNVITVKQDGTGDFTNPVDALSWIEERQDRTAFNKYDVHIYEGIYDIVSYLNPDAVANKTIRGLEIENFVKLTGIGSRERIILRGEMPTDTADDVVTNMSTLNTVTGGSMENLTVTARNMRYVVHADAGVTTKDYEQNIKNCYFEHFGNDEKFTWKMCSAWGSGNHSGSIREFENCTFISKMQSAWGIHTNTKFDKPAYTRAINCTFINKSDDGMSITLNGLGSEQINIFEFIGCKFNGFIRVANMSGGLADDIKVTGYGNQVVPHKFQNTDGTLREYIDFTDEVKYLIADENLVKGDIVKLNGFNHCSKITNSNCILFEGIVLEDKNLGEEVAVKYNGYIDANIVNLIANVGDKIGIVDNKLKVVTSGDYIGIVDIAGFVKLI